MKKNTFKKATKITKIIVLTAMTLLLFCGTTWYETHYTRKATVTEINNSIVTVVDECYHTWQFKGNGFHRKDKVKLLMNTNHTDSNIYDDKIENAKIIK